MVREVGGGDNNKGGKEGGLGLKLHSKGLFSLTRVSNEERNCSIFITTYTLVSH